MLIGQLRSSLFATCLRASSLNQMGWPDACSARWPSAPADLNSEAFPLICPLHLPASREPEIARLPNTGDAHAGPRIRSSAVAHLQQDVLVDAWQRPWSWNASSGRNRSSAGHAPSPHGWPAHRAGERRHWFATSVMPHLGHSPGALDTTSACIEHV